MVVQTDSSMQWWLWGDAATINQGLRTHLKAGANQVCIQPVHTDGDLNARDRTLTALANV
jgi:hypothetical protein